MWAIKLLRAFEPVDMFGVMRTHMRQITGCLRLRVGGLLLLFSDLCKFSFSGLFSWPIFLARRLSLCLYSCLEFKDISLLLSPLSFGWS